MTYLPKAPLSHADLFTILLCTLVLWAFPAGVSANGKSEQQAKFEEVKKNIEALKAELEKTKGSRDNLQETLKSNEEEIRKLNNKKQKLDDAINKTENKLNDLQNEQSSLIKKKNEQQGLVKNYINAAHRLGQQSQIRLLLNQQDPAQIARMLKYYEAFSRSRSQKIEAFVTTIERLQKIEPEIIAEKSNLQTTHAKLKIQQKKLHSSRDERQKILTKLEQDLTQKQHRLQILEQDRRRLENIVSYVAAEIDAQELNVNITDFIQLKGKMPWPTKGKTLNRYGSARAGRAFKWQGLQIAASRGTHVIAVHHGQVVFSDYLRGHGLLLIIDHGAGYMSLYAHNENLYKEIGEWVKAGEVIASVGDSGGRKDTALYFELRHDGKPTNPISWFRPA